MDVSVVDKDDQYVLNHCTKYLSRDSHDARHDFGQFPPGDPRATIAEAWRFPIVDSDGSYPFNDVTFVYDGRQAAGRAELAVVGTFAKLYDPVPLRPLEFLGEASGFSAVTLRIPKGQVHTYKVLVDGRPGLDPINPQTATLDNGLQWSRFFTEGCQFPLELNRRERAVLQRLVAHLLPFRLEENRQFIRGVYDQLDRSARGNEFPLAYRLDVEVGVTNYIDKLIARAERHNADDYHICLSLIDALLRRRMGGLDPVEAPPELYAELYDQMAGDRVDGWDTSRYGGPRYFLLLLRRHAMTGAFVHPRHGGNSGAAGWMYLEDRFRNDAGQTLFDWRAAIEQPLGHNHDYRG